jgi:hypothetical protein
MNYPSIKTIETRLAEDLKKQGRYEPKRAARLIRALMGSATCDRTGGQRPCDALEIINEILDGHGVAVLTDNEWDSYYCNIGVEYVNMGDSYAPTVCYDTRKQRWMVCSWADLVEKDRKRFCG